MYHRKRHIQIKIIKNSEVKSFCPSIYLRWDVDMWICSHPLYIENSRFVMRFFHSWSDFFFSLLLFIPVNTRCYTLSRMLHFIDTVCALCTVCFNNGAHKTSIYSSAHTITSRRKHTFIDWMNQAAAMMEDRFRLKWNMEK